MVAVAVALAVAAAAGSGGQLGARWDLGHGFTAVVLEKERVVGGFTARRSVEIRRRGRLLQRFSSRDEGLGVQVADLTGDGVRDVLTLDYQGGTGVCGTYRLYGGRRFRELWVRAECADIGIVKLAGGALVLWNAVLASKTRDSNGSPHCCWRTWRRTVWRWDGGRLRVGQSSLAPPPSASYRGRVLPGTFPFRR
jgi:hypothetical protein